MWMTVFLSGLSFIQAPGERTPQGPTDRVEAVFARAARESDIDEAGLILSSLLSDEATIRSAFSTSAILDERLVDILFGGNWGSRARVAWRDTQCQHRILVELTSTKPLLIRSIICADRYETYIRRRHPQGAATINYFPFFSFSHYVDDLGETFIESLRKEIGHPAEALVHPHDSRPKSQPPFILVTAEEMEFNLLSRWQMLCGVCDRLDLIENATPKNWRDRFPRLEKWFQENRPYILWDNDKSRIRIDETAKKSGRPTPKTSRSIRELKPIWQSGEVLKQPVSREKWKNADEYERAANSVLRSASSLCSGARTLRNG